MSSVVTVPNTVSTLACLAMISLGARIAYRGLLGVEHGNHSATILDVTIVAACLIVPAIWVAASASFVMQKPWPSIPLASIRLRPIVNSARAIELRFPV